MPGFETQVAEILGPDNAPRVDGLRSHRRLRTQDSLPVFAGHPRWRPTGQNSTPPPLSPSAYIYPGTLFVHAAGLWWAAVLTAGPNLKLPEVIKLSAGRTGKLTGPADADNQTMPAQPGELVCYIEDSFFYLRVSPGRLLRIPLISSWESPEQVKDLGDIILITGGVYAGELEDLSGNDNTGVVDDETGDYTIPAPLTGPNGGIIRTIAGLGYYDTEIGTGFILRFGFEDTKGIKINATTGHLNTTGFSTKKIYVNGGDTTELPENEWFTYIITCHPLGVINAVRGNTLFDRQMLFTSEMGIYQVAGMHTFLSRFISEPPVFWHDNLPWNDNQNWAE